MTQPILSEKQKKAYEYLRENHVEEILADLLNSLANSLNPKPIIFMIKYLAALSNLEDLTDNGISIQEPLLKPNIAVLYPKYKIQNKNFFKTYFTQQIFAETKNLRTNKNVNIRNLVSIALENENHPIGIFAPDEETYTTFSKLFEPILMELNEGVCLNESFECQSIACDSSKLRDISLRNDENKFIKSIKIKIRRNLANHSFNCYLAEHEREKVKHQIQQALFKKDNNDFESESWGLFKLNFFLID